jgi:hypothetical protein
VKIEIHNRPSDSESFIIAHSLFKATAHANHSSSDNPNDHSIDYTKRLFDSFDQGNMSIMPNTS